jgi:N-acetylglucosaminyldiphosphoundecaprenol N-acetyl-beta-D-mannosaminyltransferase
VARVRAARPDILLVAYGAPQQDKWIARNRERLGAPVSIGVGGSFDFVAEEARRAPVWIRRLGLEWLHRVGRQPWRARRILTAVVLFPLAVLRHGRGD